MIKKKKIDFRLFLAGTKNLCTNNFYILNKYFYIFPIGINT